MNPITVAAPCRGGRTVPRSSAAPDLLVVRARGDDLTNVVVAHVLVVLVTVRADLAFKVLVVAAAEVNVVVCFVLTIHTTAHHNPLESVMLRTLQYFDWD